MKVSSLSLLFLCLVSLGYAQDIATTQPEQASAQPEALPTPTNSDAEVEKLLSVKALSRGEDWQVRALTTKPSLNIEAWSEPATNLKEAWVKLKGYKVGNPVERRHTYQTLLWNMTQDGAMGQFNYRDKHLAAALLYLLRNYDVWKSPRMQGVISDLYQGFAVQWGEDTLREHPELITEYTAFIRMITLKKVDLSAASVVAAARRGMGQANVEQGVQDAMTYHILSVWQAKK